MITEYDILRKPVLTEKSNFLKENSRQVTLEVLSAANKKQIKSAAQRLFGVKVQSVNTAIYRGKTKRVGRTMGKQSNWKKAVLTLSSDSDLDVFGVWQGPMISEDQVAA
ncbi:MAG: 50S ribosomal protein L23 [Myxococcaceae bacterium]|nr:50S ribosomal protein L23 [Myxococcaceae bacterium]MBH2006970.1 50S ribosomal protein L23 [Myxococcaceae bacterium]